MPELPLTAAQLELIQTLATVREIRRVDWDALGTTLVVQAGVGEPDRLLNIPVSVTPEAATALWTLLGQALGERADGAGTVQ